MQVTVVIFSLPILLLSSLLSIYHNFQWYNYVARTAHCSQEATLSIQQTKKGTFLAAHYPSSNKLELYDLNVEVSKYPVYVHQLVPFSSSGTTNIGNVLGTETVKVHVTEKFTFSGVPAISTATSPTNLTGSKLYIISNLLASSNDLRKYSIEIRIKENTRVTQRINYARIFDIRGL